MEWASAGNKPAVSFWQMGWLLALRRALVQRRRRARAAATAPFVQQLEVEQRGPLWLAAQN
jgi:hypothetical protein